MRPSTHRPAKHVGILLGAYFVASVAHVVHNAGYMAFYPTMPMWVTPDRVYALWLAISGIGVAGLLAHLKGVHGAGAALLAAYGLCGLLGLAHYALPLCAQHNPTTDLTIALATGSGLLLTFTSAAPWWPRPTRR